MFQTSTKFLLAVAISVVISVHEVGAVAQSTDDIAADLAKTKAQLVALQEQVARLEALLEKTEPEKTEPNNTDQISVTALEERLEDLEIVAANVDESIGSRAVVNAFDGVSLDVGGFFDTAATLVVGEEETTGSFNRQVFELLVKAELGPQWDLFVAQAFIRNAPLLFTDPQQRTSPIFADNNSPVDTDTVIAWGQYKHSDLLNVQFGRFITPHGIVNIEHFPASLLDTEKPQFLRPAAEQSIFANFTNGVNINGDKYFGNNKLGYAVYAGVSAGNATNAAFGGRLDYNIGESGLTIGVNGYSDDRTNNLISDRFYGGGIDILYDKGPILWKSEVFATSEGSEGDRFAFYTQPAIRLSDKWTVLYRYDYNDNGFVGGETVEHVGGLVFDPIVNVRLRALYRLRRERSDIGFDDASVNVFQFATTFNF